MSAYSRLDRYSLLQLLFLGFSVLVAKVFISCSVRIVRPPFLIMGKSRIFFGKGFSAGRRLRLECFTEFGGRISFGKNTKINDDVHIGATKQIRFGDNVLIGSKVVIIDHQHGCYKGNKQDSPDIPPDERALSGEPISIGNNVWIGEMSCILPGVTVGDGAVIGAGCVVSKDVAPNTIVVGNPCRPIKRYNPEKSIWERLSD